MRIVHQDKAGVHGEVIDDYAANENIDFANAQLEYGNVVTPFEEEEIETTLRRCYRYYWISESCAGSWGAYAMWGNANSAGYYATIYVNFPVPLRKIPTIGIYGAWNQNNCTGPNLFSYSSYGATLSCASSAAGQFGCTVNSSDDQIAVDAEL